MKKNRLQVGIDFSMKKADFCLLHPDGEPLEQHRSFSNTTSGYSKARRFLLETIQEHDFDGVDISGEATNYYWFPFFRMLTQDHELTDEILDLYLLNPRWVKWFKKSLPQDNKTDADDPYYIAERTRQKHPSYTWELREEWLTLRFYTRLRFRLANLLGNEKNYFLTFLFLRSSAYKSSKCFSDVFGATSQQVLTAEPLFEELDTLSTEDLAAYLYELSGHHLDNPKGNARKLKKAISESFPLGETLTPPVQRILNLTLENIHFIESLIAQVDEWIEHEVRTHHPEVLVLATIPGVGPVFSAGIAAEIGGLQRFFDPLKYDKKRNRYRSRNLRDVEDAVAKIAGLWWPRSSSGGFESEDRHMVKSSNHYLRYYLIQAANVMRRHIPEYSRFYARKHRESTKHKHKRALVLTARKSVGLVVGLLHRNEAYRPKET